ncbi:MAG: LysR family transcriptional regulator, partial [Candidatus Adiutrix sp.]|nr:LysR family transcriptional regulator [Candidatus Adiutrix sp.]
MDIQQLKIIQQTANCDFNLTKVAQTMHTSQPGISRQIRALEDELKVELFIRVGKRLVGMTQSGKEVLDIASRIMMDVANLQNIPRRFGESSTGLLRVAATATGLSRLPALAVDFHAQYPRVSVAARQQESDEVAKALRHGEADIGIAGERLRGLPDLATFSCASIGYQALLPPKHALANAKLSLEGLARYPLLTYRAGTEERLHVDNAFAAAGLKPNI